MIAVALSSMTATKRRDCLTLDGFCHLLDAIESEIKHSSARTPLHCYIEDSFPLPAGVYREIIESVFSFLKHWSLWSCILNYRQKQILPWFIHYLAETDVIQWWFGTMVMALGSMTKLLCVWPDYYWDGWPSSDGQTTSVTYFQTFCSRSCRGRKPMGNRLVPRFTWKKGQ